MKEDINFEQFSATDIRVVTILSAEKVEKADKLLKIVVDLGTETRTIASGIAQHFSVDFLVGKQVLFIANLAPRTIRGIESHGMIMVCEDADGGLKLMSPEFEVKAGSIVG